MTYPYLPGLSEDLPHKSGIKTDMVVAMLLAYWSEDLPHKSGIKTQRVKLF